MKRLRSTFTVRYGNYHKIYSLPLWKLMLLEWGIDTLMLFHRPRKYLHVHIVGMNRVVRREFLAQRDEDTKPLNL